MTGILAAMKAGSILNLVQPIFTDSSSIMDDNWETDYVSGQQNGIQKWSGKIFDGYESYHRVAISMISYTPSDDAQPLFELDIAPETGELITATDICTLMLYEKFANWTTHNVVSKKYLSIWDCQTDELVILPMKTVKKINKDQEKRHPEKI